MSARQPFLPTRPASRALNLGDDANDALTNPPSNTNDTAELGKPARALNVSSFKKSAARVTSTSFGAGPTAEFETTAQSNHTPRSAATAATARIYAPHPSTPPVKMIPPPLPDFPTPEFKTPSLPFAARSVEGPNNAHTSPADANPAFRPKSCRPQQQGEITMGGGQGAPHSRRPSSEHSSFFGNAKFPFDSPSGLGSGDHLDDSGYFSSEHAADAEIDRFGVSVKRNDHRANTTDMDARFVNSAKRGRPASPGNDEDIFMVQQTDNRPLSGLQKRPCVRRAISPSRSRGPLSTRTTAPMLGEGGAPDSRERPAFILPSHIPHPMAAMGDFPGLEFSEADLARYAELYERGSERWSQAPMEEWVAGADDVLAKFGDMIDMIKDHMSSKMNLYKSLHTKISDEHSALEQRAKELRDASQSLVRDSGTIGGALGSNGM